MCFPRKDSVRRQAFSLIELLAVMAVISLLMVATIPAFNSMGPAYRLGTASEAIMTVLDTARMEAINANTTVQLRIITGSAAPVEAQYRAYSLWKRNKTDGTYAQTTKWEILPVGVTFESLDDPSLSYPLSDPRYAGTHVLNSTLNNKNTSAYLGQSVGTTYVECYPDGSVRLPALAGSSAYLLMKLATATTNAAGTPANWRQVRINALTGQLRLNTPPKS